MDDFLFSKGLSIPKMLSYIFGFTNKLSFFSGLATELIDFVQGDDSQNLEEKNAMKARLTD